MEFFGRAEAARRAGRSPQAIGRWIRGIRSGGRIVQLRVRWRGPRAETCDAWLDEFYAACAPARRNREKPGSHARAEAELKKRGM